MTKCIENRILYIWIPRESVVWSQYMTILDVFGTYPSVLTLLLTLNGRESVLSPSTMNVAFDIIDSINNVTLHDHDGRDYAYTDLCARSTPTQPHCDSSTELFFQSLSQHDRPLWPERGVTGVSPQMAGNPHVPTALHLGGLQYAEDDPSRILSARSLRITYALQGSTDPKLQDAVQKYSREWNAYWATHHDDYQNLFEITYYSDALIDDEI